MHSPCCCKSAGCLSGVTFWGGEGGGLTVKMSLEFVTVQLPPGYPRNRLSASSFVSLQKVQTSHQATRHDGNVKRLILIQ